MPDGNIFPGNSCYHIRDLWHSESRQYTIHSSILFILQIPSWQEFHISYAEFCKSFFGLKHQGMDLTIQGDYILVFMFTSLLIFNEWNFPTSSSPMIWCWSWAWGLHWTFTAVFLLNISVTFRLRLWGQTFKYFITSCNAK